MKVIISTYDSIVTFYITIKTQKLRNGLIALPFSGKFRSNRGGGRDLRFVKVVDGLYLVTCFDKNFNVFIIHLIFKTRSEYLVIAPHC